MGRSRGFLRWLAEFPRWLWNLLHYDPDEESRLIYSAILEQFGEKPDDM